MKMSDKQSAVSKLVDLTFESCYLKDGTLNESTKESLDESVAQAKDALKSIQTPKDVEDFIQRNQARIHEIEAKLGPRQKRAYQKVWEYLKFAAAKGWEFIKKHWWKVLQLILLIVLAWFAWDWFLKMLWQFNVSATHMMRPGETLQDFAIQHGEKPISDGWAHVLNQMNNWD